MQCNLTQLRRAVALRALSGATRNPSLSRGSGVEGSVYRSLKFSVPGSPGLHPPGLGPFVVLSCAHLPQAPLRNGCGPQTAPPPQIFLTNCLTGMQLAAAGRNVPDISGVGHTPGLTEARGVWLPRVPPQSGPALGPACSYLDLMPHLGNAFLGNKGLESLTMFSVGKAGKSLFSWFPWKDLCEGPVNTLLGWGM